MDRVDVKYAFDEEKRFVIENYNWSSAFSSFFPGIAGKTGIPLWGFYVNRGQAVCSLGSRDKNGAILEFLSFNRACQLVGLQGFRTFIRSDGGPAYEPFRKNDSSSILQRMTISSYELELTERHAGAGLDTNVTYFPLVNLPVGGLVRWVTIRNTSDAPRDLQVIDGAPRVLPYGISFEHVKVIPRHIEAMMGVYDLEGIPFYKLKQTPADIEQIGEISGVNFYFSATRNEGLLRGNTVVDPEVVFGMRDDFERPWGFEARGAAGIASASQLWENRTPSAFTVLQETIAPGEEMSFYSVLGHASEEGSLEGMLNQFENFQFIEGKRHENRMLIEQIENLAFTASAEPLFDQYCQQTFLDNVIRGGMPESFGKDEKRSIFYVYGRQGGDLERDYHWFTLEPTYLSQGNGHFRNVCQNRRMDTWFFPEIKDHNIQVFMNLIQTDGYNPLVINGQTYTLQEPESVEALISGEIDGDCDLSDLIEWMMAPFTPGELLMRLEGVLPLREPRWEQILGGILACCRLNEIGDLHEGFWIDHWSYLLDFIDVFLSIHPDSVETLLIDQKVHTFYDNPDLVQPRVAKTIRIDGMIRQYGAVIRDEEKARLIESRDVDAHKMRTRHGQGEVYRTNLLTKLLCIVANRLASLDPSGLGVEMEAGKPGWADALNGLPGLLGSSLCQTLELLRAIRTIQECLSRIGLNESDAVPIFSELAVFIVDLTEAVQDRLASEAEEAGPIFWEKSHDLLESYRAGTRLGIGGGEQHLKLEEINRFLRDGSRLLEKTFETATKERTLDPGGVPYTYFINEVLEYESVERGKAGGNQQQQPAGREPVRSLKFQQTPVALFLEGPMHYVRVFPERAAEVYASVRESGIFDRSLRTFKICESLADQPTELGRITAYPPGWIENESVYTHMGFKWLLETLRSGLVDRFFEDIRATLPPFLSPTTYGRSTLENCSFMVSSAFPKKSMHGQAFQPRLSGVTAEMLQIWTTLVAGGRPFSIAETGELRLRLRPTLPEWLFTREANKRSYWSEDRGWETLEVPKDCFAFRFLGGTLVVYHNPDRKPTFGEGALEVKSWLLRDRDGEEARFEGEYLVGEAAIDVREGTILRIDVTLG